MYRTYCQPNGWFSGLGSNSSTINTTLGALNSDGIRYSLLATIGPYPGATPSTAQTTVTQYFGWAVVNALPNASYITVIYNLTNMPPSSSGGLHVHTGTTCSVSSMVGGHYWAPASSPDPWNSNTMWTSDASGNAVGSFNVTSGYQYAANLHHAMVVHLPNGTRFGCGVLDSFVSPPLFLSLRPAHPRKCLFLAGNILMLLSLQYAIATGSDPWRAVAH